MVGNFQLTVDQASRGVPLLPEWSLTLGLFVHTFDRACYDRAFHTLGLERVRYLRSLDRETELDSIAANGHDLEAKLGATTAKVWRLRLKLPLPRFVR